MTFLGAAVIILLIKVTPLLLPAKYYFDFSKLVGGDSEPFIVDPPGVTGTMLCELITKHGVPKESFRKRIVCNEDFERGGPPFTAEEINEIYGIALRADDRIRKAFVDAARSNAFKPLSDAEVRRLVSKQSNTASAFDELFKSYALTLSEVAQAGPSEIIDQLFAKLIGPPDYTAEPQPEPSAAISSANVERLVQANRSFVADLNIAAYVTGILPIKKTMIDEIIDHLRERGMLKPSIEDYYTEQMKSALHKKMSARFESFGVVTDMGVIQREVFNDINKFSGIDYIVAILVRLTPVFLFGIVAGAMVGRGELLSISLAGGLAAFLLSWPLILMWDRLVQSNWADKKPIFFSFYAAYILSFFLLARAAAVLGTWLREQRIVGMPSAGVTRMRWSYVTMNLMVALAINGLVYAWNVYLPLGGIGR
jgi:hypothetical protein